MASKIDICNQALLKVGADLIASLDTAGETDTGVIRSAKLCKALYDQALEEVLRMYTWNCCVARAIPSRLQDAPSFGYDYAFQLPNDCLRVVAVYEDEGMYDDGLQWVVEQGQILCDYEAIYLKYVRKPDNVNILDSLCTQAVICNLALKLCVALQLDDDWATRISNELHGIVMPQARSIDTFENKELMLEESDWILSRNYDTPII